MNNKFRQAAQQALEEAAGVCENTLAQHYMKQVIPTHDEALLLAACADCAAAIRALKEQPAEQESVSCWNALQDFSTEALEHRSHLLKAEDDQIAMLTTQRDELLAALKKAAEHIEAMIIEHKPLRLKQHCWQQVRNARAAIAKVEGGAA